VRDIVHSLIAEHFASDPEDGEEADSSISPLVDAGGEVGRASPNPPEPVPGLHLVMPKHALRGGDSVVVQLDGNVDFRNDTGVIGRVSVQQRRLTFDLKVQLAFKYITMVSSESFSVSYFICHRSISIMRVYGHVQHWQSAVFLTKTM
jgi:hypothetical protein